MTKAKPPSAPEPWERQEGEPAKAYAGFIAYRDLDTSVRSVDKAALTADPEGSARRVRPADSKWLHWATDYHWVARADAWDLHQDYIRRQAHEAEIRAMGTRHARMHREYSIAFGAAATAVLRRFQRNPEEIQQMVDRMRLEEAIGMLSDLSGALTANVRGERLAMGLSTENLALSFNLELELKKVRQGALAVGGDPQVAEETFLRLLEAEGLGG
jgi:hypothetical protein